MEERLINVEQIQNSTQLKLTLHEQNWHNALRTSNENKMSTHDVVSFLGKTQVGKSTIIKHILSNQLNYRLPDDATLVSTSLPGVAKSALQTSPTTAGVCFYKRLVSNLSTIYLADYEGEDGGTIPSDSIASGIQGIHDAAARTEVTKSDLRRLSYVTSHVIVYIADRPIADKVSNFNTIVDFAQKAVEAVGNADIPNLIIVNNKVDLANADDDDEDDFSEEELKHIIDVDISTNDFFETHDPQRSLLRYFNDIRVVRIPNKSTRDIKCGGQTIKSKNLYLSQLDVLFQTIQTMLHKKNEFRLQKGNLTNETTWLLILERILQSFYLYDKNVNKWFMSPIDMSSTLLTLLTGEDFILGTTAFFEAIRERMLISRRCAVKSITYTKAYPLQEPR
jgi:hypothetical protein